MRQLCDKLELDKVMAKYVKESDEEESRTVEMYDMVSLVSTRSSRLSRQITTGEQDEQDVQQEGNEQAMQEGEEQEAQHSDQSKSSSEEIRIVPKQREQIGEVAKRAVTAVPRCIVDMDTIRREQEQQPVMDKPAE